MRLLRRRNYRYNAEMERTRACGLYGADGYIHGQGGPVISRLRYGLARMGAVGCELIAIYNALNALGCAGSISEIADYYERHPGQWLFGLWGTKSKRIPDYMRRYPDIRVEPVGARAAEDTLTEHSAAIITFWNPRAPFHGIHTVTLTPAPCGGVYAYNFYSNSTSPARFASIEDMLGFHGKRRFIRAFVVGAERGTEE